MVPLLAFATCQNLSGKSSMVTCTVSMDILSHILFDFAFRSSILWLAHKNYPQTIVKSFDIWWWGRPFVLGDEARTIVSCWSVQYSSPEVALHYGLSAPSKMSSMYTSLLIFTPWGTKTGGNFPPSEITAQTITDARFAVWRHFPEAGGNDWQLEWMQSFWRLKICSTVNSFLVKIMLCSVPSQIHFTNSFFWSLFFIVATERSCFLVILWEDIPGSFQHTLAWFSLMLQPPQPIFSWIISDFFAHLFNEFSHSGGARLSWSQCIFDWGNLVCINRFSF